MNKTKFVLYTFIFLNLFFHIPSYARKKKKKKKHPANPVLIDSRKGGITNYSVGDGFGGQVIHIITAMIHAELNKKEFFYSPFCKMEHNYDNDPEYLLKKEKLLNLIGNVKTISQADKANYKITTDSYLLLFDRYVAKYAASASLRKLKQIFRANKNRADFFDDAHLHIAVHIRRFYKNDTFTYRTDIPDDLYLKIINKLRIIYDEQNPLFHIYSQGNLDNFTIYQAQDTILHINESVENTYTSLVLADILVAGNSSFSYTAGYLSDGIVYYNSYMHAPFPHWIPVEALLI